MKEKKNNKRKFIHTVTIAAYIAFSVFLTAFTPEEQGKYLICPAVSNINSDDKGGGISEAMSENTFIPVISSGENQETETSSSVSPSPQEKKSSSPEKAKKKKQPSAHTSAGKSESGKEEAAPESGTKEKIITVTATAYCGCYDCNGQWTGYPAADGSPLRSYHTIAADESIPFGTKVYIPYFASSPNGGYFRVSDRGSAITGNRIDIYFDSHDDALDFGMRELEMHIM